MVDYPTVNFIHLCTLSESQERMRALADNLGLKAEIISPYKKDIEKIMDFISKVDNKSHEKEDSHFFDDTLHGHIASDLRSIIILSISKQKYQANIILRHFKKTTENAEDTEKNSVSLCAL